MPDSVLKTLIMMSGEFDYGTIFLREGEEAMGPVPFPFVSYAGYQSHRFDIDLGIKPWKNVFPLKLPPPLLVVRLLKKLLVFFVSLS